MRLTLTILCLILPWIAYAAPTSPKSASVAASSTTPAAQSSGPVSGVIDLGELHREGAPVYPIAIVSASSDVTEVATAAFRLHGGYRIVSQPEAAFVFRLNRVSANRIELVIESGRPAQVQFRQEVSADDAQKSILKACDLAVTKTLGIPGFFGGKLAFVNNSGKYEEVYTSDLLFRKVRQMTQDKHHCVMPHWSMDGRYLTYTGYYLSDFPDLFIIDTQTGRRRPLANYQGTNTGGVFNPAGTKIAMVLSSCGNPELYVTDAQGKNPKRLTHTKALEASPTWSPDGRKIIFTSDRLGGPQLFEMTLADASTRRIPTNLSRYCAEAAWNPVDASTLAFTGAVSKSFQIALFDFKSNKARFLTQGPGDCIEACWMNDGRHLIFTRRTGKQSRLCIIDTQTGKETALHNAGIGNISQATFGKN